MNGILVGTIGLVGLLAQGGLAHAADMTIEPPKGMAQPTTTDPRVAPPGPVKSLPTKSLAQGQPVKVQSQLHLNIPMATAQNPSEEIKTMEVMRDSLYEISSRECATLKQMFNADCRLTGMAIDSAIDSRSSNHSINLSVSNSYELKAAP